MMNLSFILVLFILGFGISPVFAQSVEYAISDDPEVRQLQLDKIQQETRKLELENKQIELLLKQSETPSSGISDTAWSNIIQAVSISGTIIASAIGIVYKWKQIRMIPPLGEQEKFFRELAKASLDASYKEQWDEINRDIRDIEDDAEREEQIRVVWEKISKRDFPEPYKGRVISNWNARLLDLINRYKLENLKGNEESILLLAKTLTTSVHSEYFKSVGTELPVVIEIVVEKSLLSVSGQKFEERLLDWRKKSRINVINYMIARGLSEHEDVVFDQIDANIRGKLDKIKDKKVEKKKEKSSAEAIEESENILEEMAIDKAWGNNMNFPSID